MGSDGSQTPMRHGASQLAACCPASRCIGSAAAGAAAATVAAAKNFGWGGVDARVATWCVDCAVGASGAAIRTTDSGGTGACVCGTSKVASEDGRGKRT